MLYTELQLRKPETIEEMFNIARKVDLEEGSEQDTHFKKEDKFSKVSSRFDKKRNNWIKKTESFTPLNILIENLISVIKEKYGVQDPTPMLPQNLPVRDKTKYCGFHRDYGNMMENCIQLKQVIERLIKESHLKVYIFGMQQQKDKGERIIDVITPQFSSIKQIKRKIYNLNKSYLIPEYELNDQEVISFSKKELVLNEEARITPIELEVEMTWEGIESAMLKSAIWHKSDKKHFVL